MRYMRGKAVCDASGCGVNLRNLGQQPLGAVPFGHSEHTQRFALTLVALACSLCVDDSHPCCSVSLSSTTTCFLPLENKAFMLGGDSIYVYINVFVGTRVFICVGCWHLKAVTHFSAFSFYLPSLSLFYCVTLVFTISFSSTPCA